MSNRQNKTFSQLLDGAALHNHGAKAFLASRRSERRTPFIPITLFGFVLDERGPEMMAARLEKEPGRCRILGDARNTPNETTN
jgi:hypothetical protein